MNPWYLQKTMKALSNEISIQHPFLSGGDGMNAIFK